ncbi:MAG TPA: SRPBCC family protein [Steroidobacteraceae bacterium]|nr:SRPBCC family protein [Gammaproteobacteria bacterium]HEV2285093.1 SRPBCC family protein [Steroidobacteraceae bacterium]
MSHRSPNLPLIALALSLALAPLTAAPLAAPAPAPGSGWVANPQVQRRLAAGEVVVETAAEVDPEHPRGRARAAVLIHARPEAIWRVMTDCAQTLLIVPGLKRCRRVAGAADGRWEDIEQEIRYSWYLPSVVYVFRADYDRPRRIDFHRVSGDLKEEEGSWVLGPTADGSATLVEYEMYLEPGFWVPQFLVNRSLRRDLPAVLAGLRDRVEQARKTP